MTGLFSVSQLSTLRQEYSTIGGVDPCGEVYPKLCKLLDDATIEQRRQLATANIKFVSALARNRLGRISFKSAGAVRRSK